MNAATRAWIRDLDPDALARAATDYAALVAPLGPFPPPSVLRGDFDATALARAEAALDGVDRVAALCHLAEALLAGAGSDPTARHEVLLAFVQRIAFANLWQPVHPDGSIVRDPLVLLAVGQLRCGHAASLAADLFDAAGMRSRLCLLGHHIVAEAQYEDAHGGGWHAIDADGFAGGVTPRRDDGTIPSIAELSREPDRLDACASATRPSFARLPDPPDGSVRCARILAPRALPTLYPSTAWFGANGTPPRPTGFRYAVRHADADRSGPDYGWKQRAVATATDIVPAQDAERRFPPAPRILALQLESSEPGKRRVTARVVADVPSGAPISVAEQCADVHIELCASRRTRGWQYDDAAAPGAVRAALVKCPWRPEHYDRLHDVPPDDLGHAILADAAQPDGTLDGTVTLEVPADGPVHLTAFASDAHGRRAGRALYPLSPEFVLGA